MRLILLIDLKKNVVKAHEHRKSGIRDKERGRFDFFFCFDFVRARTCLFLHYRKENHLLLLGGLVLLEDRALRVGDASNADESEVLEVGAVRGELGAGDGEGALVVDAEGSASNSLGGSVGIGLGEGNDGSLLGSTTDLYADSLVVSEARNLVADNVRHVVGLCSEGNSNVGAVSTGERVVLLRHLPDEVRGRQRQRSGVVGNLSSHFGFVPMSITSIQSQQTSFHFFQIPFHAQFRTIEFHPPFVFTFK